MVCNDVLAKCQNFSVERVPNNSDLILERRESTPIHIYGWDKSVSIALRFPIVPIGNEKTHINHAVIILFIPVPFIKFITTMSHKPFMFERPVGACRDIKELEFLACLHQTCDESRPEASLIAEDIQMLLLSRQGLKVSLEQIEEFILVDLIGNPDKFPDPVMDLRQLVTLLTIPHLESASREDKQTTTTSSSLFETVLRIILDDVGADTGEEEYPVLTVALLKKIFSVYGEENVDEQLFQQMIEKANVLFIMSWMTTVLSCSLGLQLLITPAALRAI